MKSELSTVASKEGSSQRSIPKLAPPLNEWAIPTGALAAVAAAVVTFVLYRQLRSRRF